MNLAVGIVGLPNVGKSTLFNALLKRQIAQVAEYPYTTIEPNVGVVEVPDERLDKIAEILSIKKIVPAAVTFIDIAGLIKNAHKGEGLGNQFLAKIREVDAILHVVRAFENPKVIHVHNKIDSKENVEIVNLELELADIKKPTIYVLNVDEKSITSTKSITGITGLEQDALIIPICAKLEAELSELSEEEQKAYLKEIGVKQLGLDYVIKESYKLLNLITFFTIVGGKMAQAWPIKKGSKIIEAAEMVHCDFARGFITSEVVNWNKLVEAARLPSPRREAFGGQGSWLVGKEKGPIHLAGRDEE